MVNAEVSEQVPTPYDESFRAFLNNGEDCFHIDDDNMWRFVAGRGEVIKASDQAYLALSETYGHTGLTEDDRKVLHAVTYTQAHLLEQRNFDTTITIMADEARTAEPTIYKDECGNLVLTARPTSTWYLLQALAAGLADIRDQKGGGSIDEIDRHDLTQDDYERTYQIAHGTVKGRFTKKPLSPEHIIHPEVITVSLQPYLQAVG